MHQNFTSRSIKPIATAIASIFILNSCAITQQDINEAGANYGTAIGCGAGAVIGGVIGAHFDGGRGALVGAAIGTAVGCYAGHKWQKRMIALQEFSAKERLVLDVETVVKAPDGVDDAASSNDESKLEQVGFVAQLNDTGMFNTGESKLTSGGRLTVGRLIETLLKTPAEGQANLAERRFLVVGHTDNTGSAELNQVLSEQRAKEVGKLLRDQGVSSENIFYQGAGASRPLVDNNLASGKVRNRRVEIVELNNEEALVLRIAQESSAVRYAKFTTKPAVVADAEKAVIPKPAKQKLPEKKVEIAKVQVTEPKPDAQPVPSVKAPEEKPDSQARVDFKGRSVKTAGVPNIGQNFQPKRESFALIREARANSLNVKPCLEDAPRISGQVKSLANDKPFKPKASTLDYVPGFNATVWANTINGHLVWLYPVAVLKDGFEVNQQPVLEVVDNYRQGNRKALPKIASFANVFEGEKEFLYRTYFDRANEADLLCMDVVFDRKEAKATRGYLYYRDGQQDLRYAEYSPLRQN